VWDDEWEWDRIAAEQEWAERWLDAWERLEPLGIVGPEDQNLPLSELERIAGYLG
jgi:hypothetical protein